MKKTTLGLLAITAAITAQATFYRAGLKGGFINSYDANNYTTASIADIGVFRGPIAATNRSSGVSSSSYPPVWANNRTWSFHGQMYFDGSTYFFAEGVDDAVWLKVDGAEVLKDATWNNVGVSSAVTPAAGWHDVEVRFGNGTGGAGYYEDNNKSPKNPTDANGLACGFGVTTGVKPSSMSECIYPHDPGDGSVFRCVEDGSLVSVDSIELLSNGYRFTITSSAPSPSTVVVYAGETAGAADAATGWDVDSGAVSFAANETKTVDVVGTFATPPFFVVNMYGTGTTLAEGNGVDFWEWTEIDSCQIKPEVSAALTGVAGTSGTFSVTLGYDKTIVGVTSPALTLKAYYGPEDGGTTAANWTNEVAFSSITAAGTHSCVLDNLEEGKAYVARFATKTADSDWVWSDAVSFSLAGVYLDAVPERVYENDSAEQSFKVCRPAEGATDPVTVGLSYSGATTKVSGLPASVTLPAGTAEVSVPFTLIDNDDPDGNATLTIQIVPSANYLTGDPGSAVITIVDEETAAQVCEWTGAGDGVNWSDTNNWSSQTVPTQIDTALFATHVTANLTVTMPADAIARLVRFESVPEVKLGDAATPGINAMDMSVAEGAGVVRIAANLNFANDVTFSVASNATLRLAHVSGTANLVKDGKGALLFAGSGDNNRTDGSTIVKAGRIEFGANKKTLGKRLFVGGYGEDAVAYSGFGSNWNWNPMSGDYVGTFEIGDKGVLDLSANQNSVNFQTMASFRVLKGGLIKLGKTRLLTTGRDSVHFFVEGAIESTTSAELNMAASGRFVIPETRTNAFVFNGNVKLKGDYYGGVAYEDGTAWGNRYPRFFVSEIPGVPVGITLNGHISGQGNGDGFDKRDPGVMRITSSNSYGGKSADEGMTRVHGGTLLVDNDPAEGSATGKSCVKVEANGGGAGILGGTGRVGGLASSPNATLRVGGNSSTNAIIRPGTFDDETGAFVAGTLTAGSTDQYCTTLFRDYSELRISATPRGVSRLSVVGAVSITATGTKLTLEAAGCTPDHVKGGRFRILSATDGIEGDFATIERPVPGWKVIPVMASREVEDGEGGVATEEYLAALDLEITKGTYIFVQ